LRIANSVTDRQLPTVTASGSRWRCNYAVTNRAPEKNPDASADHENRRW